MHKYISQTVVLATIVSLLTGHLSLPIETQKASEITDTWEVMPAWMINLDKESSEQISRFSSDTNAVNGSVKNVSDPVSIKLREFVEKDIAAVTENGGDTEFTYDVRQYHFDCSDRNAIGTNLGNMLFQLITDHPFEFYWLDKSTGYNWSISSTYENGNRILTGVTFSFPVSENYRVSSNNSLRLNANQPSVVKAVENMNRIVAENANKSDVEKLTAYKEYICNAVSYDYDAMQAAYNNQIAGRSDSWQLIYVFDDNPATNVVCEGYSKAFQQLCNMSTFSSGTACYTVTGYMEGGGHMWNIIRLEGKNYLADITNSDADSIGEYGFLFLKNDVIYKDEVTFIMPIGTKDDYYTTIQYDYDEYTINMYENSLLDLTAVDSSYHTGWVQSNNGGWKYLKNGVAVTGWQKIDGSWYFMNSSGIMQTGWVQDGTKWYYMNKSGAMMTGWVQDGSRWYYMNKSGAMMTGWIQDGSNWYFLNKSGAMMTGWIQDGSNWYYLNKSGVMMTGWIQDAGKWYYMNRSGVMQKGWIKDGSNWYFLNKSGVMMKGWLQDGSNWYYLNGSGAMVTGTQIIDGISYYFNASGVWVK